MLLSPKLYVYGGGEGFLWTHSHFHTLINGAMPYANFTNPHGHWLSYAREAYKVSVSLIATLFSRGSPATITGLIISSIVRESVKGMPVGGRGPHIFKEVFKGLPPRANLNPDTPVVGVRRVFGVAASGAHSNPNGVGSGSAAPMGFVSFTHRRGLLTPAGSCVPTSDRVSSDGNFCSTVTEAIPQRLTSRRSPVTLHYGEVSEFHPGEVAKFGHLVSP